MTLRIQLWSGPRNVSTALLYSFAQRADTRVVDEPLYAHFLRVSGAQHPGRDEVLAAQDPDGARVVRDVVLAPCDRPVLFVKQMAHHLVELDRAFLAQTRNVILTRDPREMLPSLVNQVPEPILRDTAYAMQTELVRQLRAKGDDVVVLDARELLLDPRGVLAQLCARLRIPFDEAMLSWKPGPRPEDGVWAPHWYHNVHRSAGFETYSPKSTPFPPRLEPLYAECKPHYDELAALALRARTRLPDPRNEHIWVHVGGRLLPRAEAKVSVFDSSVQGGDACWEGLRVYDGRVFKLDAHLERLENSAKALAFESCPSRDSIRRALFETLERNGMRDQAHVRLTLTRGEKLTSGMSPRNNVFGPCLIVLAEWKKPVFGTRMLELVTSSWRRNPPMCVDSKIHHNNLINNILAKIEADNAGVDDAVMLDVEGYVSETNATNLFLVRKGEVQTPYADHCLPGVTRGTVLELCAANDIPCRERRLSLTEFYAADEVFTTGTMGELAPVAFIDRRRIGDGAAGPMTRRLQSLFTDLTRREGTPLPF
jgi:branched-chain amino acid aminotransferase group I